MSYDEKENEIEKEENSNSEEPKKEYIKKVGNYILNEQIGIGTFSKVTKGIHTLTGEKVAVKVLDKSKIKDDIDIERISREIEILKSISHPNICQLYESNSTIHNFYLIMEYIEGGDLCDYINKNISLNEHISCHLFRQLISVIEYLYEMGITHRDIKPENILLDSSHQNIKVIDFGLSNYCADSELLKSACGSPCFASPEMLSGKPYNGITTDIWSSGIVLYSMLVGTLPFDDQELNALYDQIKIGTFYIPSTLSLEAIDFLKKILQVEPNKRMNLFQIKEHPWFNIEKNKLYKGIDLTVETFPYNEELIEYVIKRYYENDTDLNKNNFIKMIQYHACNQYTATYYLTDKIWHKNEDEDEDENLNGEKKKEVINSLKNIIKSKKFQNNDNSEIKENKNNKILNNNKEKVKNNNEEKTDTINKEKGVLKIQIKNKEKLTNIKDSKNKNTSRSNSSTNKSKGKNFINNNKDITKINLIKKELISNKKSPYNCFKTKKNSFINNKKINLFLNIGDTNKKLTHRITTILDCLNGMKISESNSKNKKNKSWQKKEKERSISKRYTKENSNILNDKTKITTRNHFMTCNFITDGQKKHKKNYPSLNKINNIRFAGSFKKKGNTKALTDRSKYYNDIIMSDELQQNLISYNNSKIQSIKAEKIKKNKTNITPNRNPSNGKKKRKKYENNSMNITNANYVKKKNSSNKETHKNKNYPKYAFIKNKNNKYMQTSTNYKKINSYNNNYIMTDNKQDKKDLNNNKIKLPEPSQSLIYMKKTYFQNKNSKTHYNKNENHNTINKYKELINEFNVGHSEGKNRKNKLKKSISKFQSEYFISSNKKIEEKLTFKNRNKYSLLMNPSQNHSLSKTKTSNNISNNNINTLSQNYSNIIDDSNNKIKPKLIKSSLKNKQNIAVNSGRYKLFHPLKYKKNNLKIKISSTNYKLNTNNISDFLLKKNMKHRYFITNRKNSLTIRNYSSFIKTNPNTNTNTNTNSNTNTNKNSENKKIKNPFSQNLSLSPENNNNANNKNNENNKKIINININNILKINKKYSISLTKSNESSKNTIYFNNNTDISEQKNVFGIKNYNSSYPIVSDNNAKYKGAIKYYSNKYNYKNKNGLIYPKISNESKNNKNYSSLLKKQLFEEQLLNKNSNKF